MSYGTTNPDDQYRRSAISVDKILKGAYPQRNCQLVARIEFTEWTPDGHLRHSKFVGRRHALYLTFEVASDVRNMRIEFLSSSLAAFAVGWSAVSQRHQT